MGVMRKNERCKRTQNVESLGLDILDVMELVSKEEWSHLMAGQVVIKN